MINQKIKNNTGFIALVSAVIISVVLLLVATNLSITSFYSRSNILDSELKEKSLALAEACADTAILKLVNNPNYNPINESVVVGGDNCIIQSVAGTNPKIISVRTNYRNYITKLEISIDPATMMVIYWKEM